MKPRLGISACLLGQCVRYDGGHKLDAALRDGMAESVEWVPVCPEAECGLGVPRPAMRLVGDPADPRLVTRETGVDHTERMKAWVAKRLAELEKEDLAGFVLKARSPSCGLCVKVLDAAGAEAGEAPGLFARVFRDRFPDLSVSEDEALHGASEREEFIRRVTGRPGARRR